MKKILLLFTLLALFSCGKDGGSAEVPVESVNSGPSVKQRYIMYEANPKCFAGKNSIQAIESRLDKIKALGVDILWVMPIYPVGQVNSVNSPYCVRDFKAVNPSFGTLADFKSLVASAHGKGMKVMLDWVPNHTAWDNSWVSEHPDWYTQDSNGNIISPAGTGWNDVADLNYNNAEMRAAMVDAMKYWIVECDIDGYRCDYAHGVPDDFWRDAIGELKALKESIVMLAESDYDRLFNCGFDVIFCRAYKTALVNMFGGRMKPSAFLSEGYRKNISSVPEGKTKLFFITNHDDASENCPIVQFPGADAALAAFVLSSALDCSSLIYSSQEIAYNSTINFFNNTVMSWMSGSSYSSKYESAMAGVKKLDRNGELKTWASDNAIIVSYPNGSLVVNVTGSEIKLAVPAGLNLGAKKLTLQPYEFRFF